MSNQTTAKARCIVEITVECDSRWGGECTIEQVIKQAKVDAEDTIAKLITDAVTPDADLKITRRPKPAVSKFTVKSTEITLVNREEKP